MFTQPLHKSTYNPELLINGDMELDSNWYNYGVPLVNIRDNTYVQEGSYSRKIISNSLDVWSGTQSELITYILGVTYTVRYWVYTLHDVYINTEFMGNQTNTYVPALVWKFIELDFTRYSSPDLTTRLRMMCGFQYTEETFWVDNASVKRKGVA